METSSLIDKLFEQQTAGSDKQMFDLIRIQFEYSPDYIFVVNKEFTILLANQKLDQVCSRESLIGNNLLDVAPPQIKHYISKQFESCIKLATSIDFELKIFEINWVKVRVVPMLESGEVCKLLIFVTDITAKIQAEEKLKSNELKFHKLIENISDTILLIDENFKITYQSPNSNLFKNAPQLFFGGTSVLDLIHPNDVFDFNALLSKSFHIQGESIQFQARIFVNQEEYCWIEGSLKNLISDKCVGGIIINFRDITQRKNAEIELTIAKLKAEKSLNKLALAARIIDSSEDAIFSKDLDGNITSWNIGASKIFGYQSEEIIGRTGSILFVENDSNEDKFILDKLLAGESVNQYETKRITKDGRIIYVSISVSAIHNEKGEIIGISKVIRDITDKKMLEQDRLHVLEDLIQRNRDLEQFSFIVSHNLRAPVANILGLTDMLGSEDLDKSVQDELISGLNKSAIALDTVIRDLNYILQTKREINEPHIEVNISQMLSEIKLSIANLIREEDVVIEEDFSELNHLSTVKTYLYSIFYNLISNAIKYRRPTVQPIIQIRSSVNKDGVTISFKDNGLGIDLAKKGSQLFMLYKRFHYHTEGKGMGLYMVKSQVESLGGKISVSSEVNNGTQFTIHFPHTSN